MQDLFESIKQIAACDVSTLKSVFESHKQEAVFRQAQENINAALGQDCTVPDALQDTLNHLGCSVDRPYTIIHLLYQFLMEFPCNLYLKGKGSEYVFANESMNFAFAKFSIERDFHDDESLLNDETAVAVTDNDQMVLLSGVEHKMFEHVKSSNGASGCYLVCKKPLVIDDRLVGIIGSSIELSEPGIDDTQIDRMMMTQRIQDLESENELLSQIIDAVPGHLYWKDFMGRYCGANSLQLSVLGFKERQSLIGKNMKELFPDFYQDVEKVDMGVIDRGTELKIEEQGFDVEGNPAWYYSIKTPLYTDDRIVGMLGLSFDMTERKRLEKSLDNTLGELRKTNAFRQEFIANMSHDLKSPVAGIISLCDYLLSGQEVEHTTDVINDVAISANALYSRLTSILEAVNMSSDSLLEVFNVNDLIADILNLFKSFVSDKKITIDFVSRDESTCWVKGDRHRYYHIVHNIIGNALKYTKIASTVRLSLNLAQLQDARYLFVLSVQDSGTGIDSNYHDAVFMAFKRLEPSYERGDGGSGLGLYIVKRYVEILNGTYRIENRSDGVPGLIFTVKVPFELAQCPNRTCIEDTQVTVVPPGACRPLKAMVLEDDLIAQKALGLLLGPYLKNISMATAIFEAKVQIETNDYDIIFLDNGLPDGSGFSLLESIRKKDQGKSHATTVVALSAHLSEQDSIKLCDAGFDFAIIKPIRTDDVKMIVSQAFC